MRLVGSYREADTIDALIWRTRGRRSGGLLIPYWHECAFLLCVTWGHGRRRPTVWCNRTYVGERSARHRREVLARMAARHEAER